MSGTQPGAAADSPPRLGVDVAGTDGSYVVTLAGRTWLHSGALRFFVNGEWHGVSTSAAEPVPICGPGKPERDVATGSV